MKRHISALVLMLAVVSLLGSLPAAAAERPFHLNGAGTVIDGVIQAAGTATHLGRFAELGTLTFAPDPENPGRVLVSGEAVFTSASGDEINGVITDASLDLATGIGTGTFRFIGGTGRFEGVSGDVGFVVLQNLATGEFEITGAGRIDY